MSTSIDVSPQQIINLYQSGITATDTATKLSVGVATVLKYLRINNIPIRHSFHKDTGKHINRSIELDISELKRLYLVEHLPTTEIAKRFGVSFTTILGRLRKHNIPIRDSHYNEFAKNRITVNNLHPNIENIIIENNQKFASVTCPICGQTRKLKTLRSIKNNDSFTGKCRKCAMSELANVVDVDVIKNLYIDKKFTTKQIAKHLNTSNGVIRLRIAQLNIPTRKKGVIKTLSIINKGTIENPKLGDIQRGTSIGIKDKSYYLRVACIECNSQRWEIKSRAKRNLLCKRCSMIKCGLEHSREKASSWLGGISFEPYGVDFNNNIKAFVRKRDNYACQICGFLENGKRLSIHHIDYNKNHNYHENLISLCHNCHSETNHNRPYWTSYFQNLMRERNLLIADLPQTPTNFQAPMILNTT